MTETKIKRTDWVAIELDQTEYWSDEIRVACGKIMTVYVYDRSVHTYCCEMTPSYYLIPVYSYAFYPDHVYDMSDEERENYQDKWDEQLRKGDSDDSPSYYHVHNIDNIDEKYKKALDVNREYEHANSEEYYQHEREVEDYVYENKPFC